MSRLLNPPLFSTVTFENVVLTARLSFSSSSAPESHLLQSQSRERRKQVPSAGCAPQLEALAGYCHCHVGVSPGVNKQLHAAGTCIQNDAAAGGPRMHHFAGNKCRQLPEQRVRVGFQTCAENRIRMPSQIMASSYHTSLWNNRLITSSFIAANGTHVCY